MFFEETDELLGRAVVGEPLGCFALAPQKFLKNFLNRQSITLPMPVRWQLSCT